MNSVTQETIVALEKNGITAEVVERKEDVLKRVQSLIPHGAEVMTMTSVTLEQTGIADYVQTGGSYVSIKNKLMSMDRTTQSHEMQQMGAAPQWALGSLPAITRDGILVSASATGSQQAAYVYGAEHVLFVVSTKKITTDFAAALERIQNEVVPLESVRARKAYHLPDDWNTSLNKLLVIYKEAQPGRIHVIFVEEDLGF